MTYPLHKHDRDIAFYKCHGGKRFSVVLESDGVYGSIEYSHRLINVKEYSWDKIGKVVTADSYIARVDRIGSGVVDWMTGEIGPTVLNITVAVFGNGVTAEDWILDQMSNISYLLLKHT